MKRFFAHAVHGYVRVYMSGYSPERFFNLCKNNGIEIWDILCPDGSYHFLVYLPDYRKVRPLVRKAGVHMKLAGRYGLPFFLQRNRKRKPFAAGIAAFFLILFLLSRFLWDIEIMDNVSVTDDMMMHWLAAHGIVCGMQAAEVDCAALEEELRMDFPEIIWVSARVSGTRLLIRLKEGTVKRKDTSQEEQPADLVAARDGVITALIVRSGVPLVHAGDQVKKGDVLVSGEIPVYGDSDELLETRRVRADADIIARTEYTVKKQYPARITERVYTGRRRYGAELRMGPQTFVWMLPAAGDNFWRLVSEKRQAAVFGDFYLPVWFSLIRADEYVCYERGVRAEERETEKELQMRRTEENFLQKGVAIAGNDVTILTGSDGYEIQERLLLSGPIGEYRDLPEKDEMQEVKGEQAAE